MSTVEDLFDAGVRLHVRAAEKHFSHAGHPRFVASTDPMIFTAMMGETLTYVLTEREAARFGNMNAALDWFARYRQRMLNEQIAANPDIGDTLLAHMRVLDEVAAEPEIEIQVSGTALTQDELVALGIDDDQGEPT